MKKLSFNQARDCVLKIYEQRGYDASRGLITVLSKTSLIDLPDRTNLSEMVFMLYNAEETAKEEKRLKKKALKNLRNK